MERHLCAFEQSSHGHQNRSDLGAGGHLCCTGYLDQNPINKGRVVLDIKQKERQCQAELRNSRKDEFFVRGQGGARAIRKEHQQLVQAYADGNPADEEHQQMIGDGDHGNAGEDHLKPDHKSALAGIPRKIPLREASQHHSQQSDKQQHD